MKDDYKYRYIIQENSEMKIKETLNSQGIKNELEMLKLNITQGEASVNDIVKTLRDICINISDKAFKRVPFANDRSKSRKGKSNEWFDEECKEMKRQVNKKRKSFQNILKDPTKTEQRESYKRMYFDQLRVFNKLKKKKENDYWKSRKQNLGTFLSKDPKEFWNQLKIKRTEVNGKFEKQELLNFFSKLASEENMEDVNSSPTETVNPERDDTSVSDFIKSLREELDKDLELKEVKTVINGMKNGKAAGIDKLIPELLKSFDDNMLDIVLLVLNLIFQKGIFPEEWAIGVIIVLFKDGDKSDLNNYRGITLLSVLGKILVGVLNNRLSKVCLDYNLLDENQCGFRRGYRTSDHIFTLSTLINHYSKVKNKKLYLCFVDFRKAFDKVSHSVLWTKLLKYGIEGKFMNIIKSMYAQVKSCVRAKSGLTDLFQYKRGVRQGCLLSPILFALFLNDLQDYLFEGGTKGINLWDITICTLLYADDLVLIAESECDLKLQMDILGRYADYYRMEINPKKTKVMIFNERRKTDIIQFSVKLDHTKLKLLISINTLV